MGGSGERGFGRLPSGPGGRTCPDQETDAGEEHTLRDGMSTQGDQGKDLDLYRQKPQAQEGRHQVGRAGCCNMLPLVWLLEPLGAESPYQTKGRSAGVILQPSPRAGVLGSRGHLLLRGPPQWPG